MIMIRDVMQSFCLQQILVKDLAHGLVNVLSVYNKHLWLPVVLKQYRSDMPAYITHGRRFPRDLSHALISMWSAEETLIFIRHQWRHVFQSMYESYEGAILQDMKTCTETFGMLKTIVVRAPVQQPTDKL